MVQLTHTKNGSSQETHNSKGKIRVFIVEDHPVVRQGMSLIIQSRPDMEVVGESGDGLEAVERIQNINPDVVLMDLEIPGLSGIEATRRLAELTPETSILILTAYDREDLLFQALQAGASGYALKGMKTDDLLAAIRTVNSGEVCISPCMATKLVGDYLKRSKHRDEYDMYDRLSAREREVLPLLAEGNSHHTIAERLHVSPYTVQTYRQRIMRKLDIHTGTDLLRYALRKGLVSLES